MLAYSTATSCRWHGNEYLDVFLFFFLLVYIIEKSCVRVRVRVRVRACACACVQPPNLHAVDMLYIVT